MSRIVTFVILMLPVVVYAADEDVRPDPRIASVKAALKSSLKGLDQKKVEFSFENNGEALEIKYLPQTFKIHGVSRSGDVALETHDEVGPSAQGFVLRVYLQNQGEINQAVTPQTLHRPYWMTDLDVTPLAKTDKQIYWALSYGARPNKEVLNEIRSSLKELAE